MQDKLNDLIRRLYSAPHSETGWEDFFTSLLDITDSKSGVLSIANDSSGLDVRPQIFSGFKPEDLEDWASHYINIDPWVLEMSKQPEGRFYRGDDLYPRYNFLRSEIFNEWNHKMDAYHAMGGMISNKDAGVTLQIALQRGPVQGEHQSQALKIADSIVPHVKQAVWIESQFGSVKHSARLLESLADAAFLCDKSCKVHHMNSSADALCRTNSVAQVKDGYLATSDSKQVDLRSTVTESATASSSMQLSKVFRLKWQDNLYVIRIVPWNLDNTGLSQKKDLVLITFRKVGSNLSWSLKDAAMVFSLTNREAEVARLLAQGTSPIEVSDTLQLSVSTVRSHIKSLLHKTEVKSLQKLVSLLRSLDSSFK